MAGLPRLVAEAPVKAVQRRTEMFVQFAAALAVLVLVAWLVIAAIRRLRKKSPDAQASRQASGNARAREKFRSPAGTDSGPPLRDSFRLPHS
jgi:hypothetical protein